ncbi:MAG: hypothetical protein Q9194_002876 [Teloschistes cf. exilis]
MHVQSIPMWTGSSNNYAYVVTDEASKDAVIIDPANPPEVAPVLKHEIESGKINLTAIINTHQMVKIGWSSQGILSSSEVMPALTKTGKTIIDEEKGCGRFFEGTPAEMHTALNKTLASLPDDTKVYAQPGHEYTKQNVKFLTTVLQTEPVKKLQAFAENNQQTQGKFTIGDEKQYNVFMRLDDPTVQKATGKTDPVDVMGKLREMKNSM